MEKGDVVFFAKRRLGDGMTEMFIVSPQRAIDVTEIYQTWKLRGLSAKGLVYTASNTPLLTASFADPPAVVKPLPEALIVGRGQNATELIADIPETELPCLLTTGNAIETHTIDIQGTLAIDNWGDTADYRADLSYWLSMYEREIAAGWEFYSSRLDELKQERQIAQHLRLTAGAQLPITMHCCGTTCVGCLILTAVDGIHFEGMFYSNLKFDKAPDKLERYVHSKDGQVFRQVVATNVTRLEKT